jgi:hypothetical protein
MKREAAFVLILAAGGCSAPSAPIVATSSAPTSEVSAPEPAAPETAAPETAAPETGRRETAEPIGSAGPDARCNEPKAVDRIEIAAGSTTRSPLAIGVTYGGSEHDTFEGGRTDTILRLTFQGIMEDGRLTPSAFTWRPSALAPPSWQYLGGMPLCVRIASWGPDKVTLELFESPRR